MSSSYRIDDFKPDNWSKKGIETIYSINWYGGSKKYLAAKERHVDGKICIIDPLTGKFLVGWDENAARLYVADVEGDYRDEIVILNSKVNEIRIYWNNKKNDFMGNENPWHKNNYKSQKINYYYYSNY